MLMICQERDAGQQRGQPSPREEQRAIDRGCRGAGQVGTAYTRAGLWGHRPCGGWGRHVSELMARFCYLPPCMGGSRWGEAVGRSEKGVHVGTLLRALQPCAGELTLPTICLQGIRAWGGGVGPLT